MSGMGKLIALEGADCAGKSSIILKLKATLPVIYDDELFIYTREPGSMFGLNNKSEQIRHELLTNKSLTAEEQAELFAESRYLHTLEIIKYLKQGMNVITDRYLFSSIIYQGLVLGFDKVYEINKKTIDLLKENNIDIQSIVFQITEDTYNERMSLRNKKQVKDAMEDVEHCMVLDRIQCYNDSNKIAKDMKVYNVNANGTKYNEIYMDVLKAINDILKEEK